MRAIATITLTTCLYTVCGTDTLGVIGRLLLLLLVVVVLPLGRLLRPMHSSLASLMTGRR